MNKQYYSYPDSLKNAIKLVSQLPISRKILVEIGKDRILVTGSYVERKSLDGYVLVLMIRFKLNGKRMNKNELMYNFGEIIEK